MDWGLDDLKFAINPHVSERLYTRNKKTLIHRFLISQPSLSPAQIARSAIWTIPTTVTSAKESQIAIEPPDIIQHVISDCSVCAAVTVCVAYQKRLQFKVRVLIRLL